MHAAESIGDWDLHEDEDDLPDPVHRQAPPGPCGGTQRDDRGDHPPPIPLQTRTAIQGQIPVASASTFFALLHLYYLF